MKLARLRTAAGATLPALVPACPQERPRSALPPATSPGYAERTLLSGTRLVSPDRQFGERSSPRERQSQRWIAWLRWRGANAPLGGRRAEAADATNAVTRAPNV